MKGAPATARRELLGAALVLFALAAIAYGSCLTGGQTLLLRDVFVQFQGPREFYREALRAGALPGWNPYIGCGTPFLANPQNGVFYPFTLLFAALPFGPALALYIALHQAALGLFSYLLGRALRLSFWGALLAGFIAGFGGIPVKDVEYLELLGGLAWTPLVLLAGWKCLTSPGRRPAGLLGLAFGLQLLAGSPYPPLYSVIGLACVGVATAPATSGRRGRGARAVAAGLALGGLIGAAQYAPTLLLVRDLPADQFSGLLQGDFSLRLRDLADFASPWLAGFPNWQKCFYVGLAGLAFAGLGLGVRRGDPDRAGWRLALALVAVGLMLAQGSHLGIDRLIDALPFVGRAGKWPTLALSLSVLGFALLAGLGLDRRLESAGSGVGSGRAARILEAALAALGLALAVDALRGGAWLSVLGDWLFEKLVAFHSPSMAPADPAGEAARLAFVCLLLVGWLEAVRRSGGRGRAALAGAALAIAVAELGTAGWNLNFRADAAIYAEPEPRSIAAILGPDRGGGPGPRVLVPGSFRNLGDILYGSRSIREFQAVRSLFNLDTVMAWGIFTTQGGGSVPLPDYPLRLEPLLDAFSAEGSAAALRALGAWNVGWILRGGVDATGLHCDFVRNPSVLPRARLVEANRNEPSADAALEAIAEGRWDPELVLTLEADGLPEMARGEGDSGEVEAVRYGVDDIRVACAADRPSFLVLAENWANGWTAQVDGAPAPVLRVNYLQQAVRVGPGRHAVVFHYRPPGLGAGILLASLGLAGVGWFGLSRRNG